MILEIYEFKPVKRKDGTEAYSLMELLYNNNKTLEINRLHKITIEFILTAIHIKEYKQIEPFDSPDCLFIYTTVGVTSATIMNCRTPCNTIL